MQRTADKDRPLDRRFLRQKLKNSHKGKAIPTRHLILAQQCHYLHQQTPDPSSADLLQRRVRELLQGDQVLKMRGIAGPSNRSQHNRGEGPAQDLIKINVPEGDLQPKLRKQEQDVLNGLGDPSIRIVQLLGQCLGQCHLLLHE